MHRQPAAIYIIGLFAQQVEKLGIGHTDEKIERVVRVGNDDEQRRFAVAQRIQLQLVVGRQLAQLLYVKRGQPRAAGNKDGLGSLARNELSRTFSSKKPCND